MYKCEFGVKGRGDFPLDMLRYDACFPETAYDVNQILKVDEERTVALGRYGDSKKVSPTVARWESFGWKVVTTYTRKM